MYTIYCKINNDGTMTSKSILPLHVGTKGDRNCTKIKCEIGNLIEGRYQYLKFYHPKSTVLLRLSNNEVVIPSNVTSIAGKWLISFISSTNAVNYSRDTFDYLFSTIPIEAEISNGLMEINILSENEKKIEEQQSQIQSMEILEKDLISMNLKKLVFPDYIESVGDYFLYNGKMVDGEITIGKNVKKIGSYTFYNCGIKKITFERESGLEMLDIYAFSRIEAPTLDLLFPASLSDFGHYCFKGANVRVIRFDVNSKITTMYANSFNTVNATEVYLPDHLERFAGNGYVFRDCTIKYLWIPNTIKTIIPQTAFYSMKNLWTIELQNGFDVSANFVACVDLTKQALVNMLTALSDRTGKDSRVLAIGETNLKKLSDSEKAIALNKNWTLS